ncbi:MAG: hypothetical protein CMI05_01120 [Oceanospirillaceae bacterium]|nr:hypothetical protein [Oceanospirillaceae bacterium]
MKNATAITDAQLGTFTVILEGEDSELLLEAIKSYMVNPTEGSIVTSLEFVDSPTNDATGTLLVTLNNEGEISTLVVPAQYGLFTEGVDEDIYLMQGTWRDGTFEVEESNNPNQDPTLVFSGALGTFVYGVQTTQAQLDSFVNGLAELGGVKSANYTGATGFGADVSLDINFTDRTWTGTFNNGIDTASDLQFGPESLGTAAVTGKLGFTATGSISGTTLNATNISAGDLNVNFGNDSYTRTISGEVNATFFGSSAQGIGGSADITKQFYEKKKGVVTSFEGEHTTTFAAEYEP